MLNRTDGLLAFNGLLVCITGWLGAFHQTGAANLSESHSFLYRSQFCVMHTEIKRMMVSLSRAIGKVQRLPPALFVFAHRGGSVCVFFYSLRLSKSNRMMPASSYVVGEKCDDAAEWNYLANISHSKATARVSQYWLE